MDAAAKCWMTLRQCQMWLSFNVGAAWATNRKVLTTHRRVMEAPRKNYHNSQNIQFSQKSLRVCRSQHATDQIRCDHVGCFTVHSMLGAIFPQCKTIIICGIITFVLPQIFMMHGLHLTEIYEKTSAWPKEVAGENSTSEDQSAEVEFAPASARKCHLCHKQQNNHCTSTRDHVVL